VPENDSNQGIGILFAFDLCIGWPSLVLVDLFGVLSNFQANDRVNFLQPFIKDEYSFFYFRNKDE